MLIAFNKPYGVLCQFTGNPAQLTLANYVDVPAVYPAGRLDADSEGLLLLTDEGKLQHRISAPGQDKVIKRYWVQVEGAVAKEALRPLTEGLVLPTYRCLPCEVDIIAEPALWPRTPPVRYRAAIPTTWLSIALQEGKNRQIRHMTARIGHPTLRLIRIGVGGIELGDLAPGQWRRVSVNKLTRESGSISMSTE